MAGLPRTKDDINFRSGQLSVSLRNTFEEIERFKVFLDSTPDADLIALGFDPQEVTVIKAAFTDLNKLSNIANAQDTQAVANDFFFWARQLMGVV